MEINLTYESCDEYMLVSVAGVWSMEAVEQAIVDVASHAHQASQKHVVIDARGLSQPLHEFNRYLAGVQIAETWRNLKVAIIYPEEQITGFTEDTAVNRGADLIVVSSQEAAIQWIRSEHTGKL